MRKFYYKRNVVLLVAFTIAGLVFSVLGFCAGQSISSIFLLVLSLALIVALFFTPILCICDNDVIYKYGCIKQVMPTEKIKKIFIKKERRSIRGVSTYRIIISIMMIDNQIKNIELVCPKNEDIMNDIESIFREKNIQVIN